MAQINANNLSDTIGGGLFTSTYDLADGDGELIVPISQKCSISIEILAGSFDYPKATSNGTNLAGTLDATIGLQVGADGVNSQTITGVTSRTLNAAQMMDGWEEMNFEDHFLHLPITQNNVTAGTVRIIVTIKT